ncbi:unnamed protein product [Pieris macdunnoughi]|uniref:Uncharacterized protein n=1 Tax=Pieris macdunnoughi TaxID=345717 RepID=A0A821SHX9_9NEOP|nr:unnamed protein product [Pieris macdunnoughi]
MLLLLLLFQQSTATEVPHQAKHIIKTIDSCPDVGYFFQRDPVPNALDHGPCLLCFCKENTSAVCWRRDNSRCDHKDYRHYGKRETRQRRSPGFSDIFFRDATRDVFDRRTPEQCKPYESSFSEGCPPADWCIGCTVCDCDANGRWDCHILSFCPDKKGNKQLKKRKRPYRSKNIKRNNIKDEKAKKKDIFKKIPPEKITQRGNTTKKFINKTHTKTSSKRSPNLNGKTIQGKKPTQVKKTTKKIQKATTKKAIDSKIIKKKSITNQQMKRNAYKEILQNVKEKNDTYKLAEAIVKKVMSSVEKLMNENQKILNTMKPKIVQKRQMPKRTNKTDNNLPRKHWIKKIKVNKDKDHPKYNTRDKRSITTSDSNATVTTVDTTTITLQLRNETKVNLLDALNISAASTKTLYYKYELNNSTIAPNQTKIEPLTSKIDINHSMRKANVSINHSIFNDTDKDFIKQLHDLKIKHNNLIASRMKLNDKWKDLQSLLSREYNKRMYKKYKENATESNIINDNNQNTSCETYSRNIIENLRKLQIIGQKLSSRSRVKRNAMGDDDAIDYLLVLMEYLLKQNKPVVNPQVSDGIDLLIDAIKNAPDIKPITFNAVRFTTFRTPTRTTDSSENKSFSSRANNKNNKSKHYQHTKTESFDDTFYDPDEKNNLKGNEMDATPFNNNKIKENHIENTEIVGEEIINSANVYFNKNPADTGIDTFLKENSGQKSSKNKYEVYNADDDEEDDDIDVPPKKLHRNKEDVYMKAEIDVEKEREKVLNRLTDVVDEVSDSKNKNATISNQDWEIDNIDLDFKVETTTKVTPKPQQVTRTARRHADKYTNPISGMSSEELENHSKPIIQSTRELKKIDIFNSFDYNTERTDVDSESKEDKNDAFSDFV